MRYREILMVMLLLPTAAAATRLELAEQVLGKGDLVAGMRLLRAAAEAGEARAQARLGEILDKAEEDKEAVAWYRKAAEQGDAAGQFGLGMAYLAGEGVPRDPGAALAWIRRAAEQNHQNAVEAMADAYRDGGFGLTPDATQAARWAARAAAIREADPRQQVVARQEPAPSGKRRGR
jgi:TPR repeat protein